MAYIQYFLNIRKDNVLETPRNGDYVDTDIGVLKTINNHDPLKLGRILTMYGWAYPKIVD